MRIVSFFEPLPDGLPDGPLALYWHDVWRENGWEPAIAGMDDALAHDCFTAVLLKSIRMPTVNDRAFNTVNWLRWLAFANFHSDMGATRDTMIFTDYDVFPRVPFSPKDYHKKGVSLRCGDIGGGPGWIEADAIGLSRIIGMLLTWTGNNQHCSDMMAFRANQNIFDAVDDLVRCYGDEGWQSVPMTHFGNNRRKDKTISREEEIKRVLANESSRCLGSAQDEGSHRSVLAS